MARKSKTTNIVSGNARVGVQLSGDVHGDLTVTTHSRSTANTSRDTSSHRRDEDPADSSWLRKLAGM